MKHYSMIVDTASGYVSIECDAETKEEAEKKFTEKVNSPAFRFVYGNLYDFKKYTIKEVM